MIPPDSLPRALELYRSGASLEAIHRALWPAGNSAVSLQVLHHLLHSLEVEDQVDEPEDDLPDDLEAAVEDLTEARGLVMQALREPGPEGDSNAGNAFLHNALARNVAASVAVQKFRLELQRHRADLADRRRARLGAAGRAPAAPTPRPGPGRSRADA